MSGSDRPLPEQTGDAVEFWEGCRRHRLLLCRCRKCGELNWFPRALCVNCGSTDREWIEASGSGTIYSYSVVHRAPSPGFDVPYTLALVDLEEGPRIMSHIVGCPPEDVRIGLRVVLRFEDLTSDVAVPVFSPA